MMDLPRAQLRLFAPLDSFPPGQRRHWEAYVASGRGLTRSQQARAEARSFRGILWGHPPSAEPEALVRRRGERVLVCPLEADVRAAVSLERFRRSVPGQVADAFLPDVGLREELGRVVATRRTPHVLDEAWLVPLHWFLAFDPSQRRVRGHAEGHGTRVVHLTGSDAALERLRRVLGAVTASPHVPEDVVDGVSALAAWIDRFSPESLLELDYGGVADLFDADELREDTTCADLWDVVHEFERDDPGAAADAFEVVRRRWAHRWLRQHAN